MASQYLKAEQQSTQYYFKVWMDTTKTLKDGVTPDPVYIREYNWTLALPTGQNATQYLANIKSEIALLVQVELTKMSPPTPAPTPLAGF